MFDYGAANDLPLTWKQVNPLCAVFLAQRATFNAQIDAQIAAIVATVPPAQQGPFIAQLEAARAQANAQIDAQLAAAGCPPAA